MRLRFRETLLYLGLRWWFVGDSRHPKDEELGTAAIARILVFSNTAIGDTLMSIPALRVLRATYPEADIRLVINPPYQELFEPLLGRFVDHFEAYDGRWKFFRVMWRRFRRFKPDMALILHSNEPQATPLAYLSGARWRFKLPNSNRFAFLLSNEKPTKTWEDFSHGIEQRLAVVGLAGGDISVQPRMDLPVPLNHVLRIEGFLQKRGIPENAMIVGFQMGASTTSRRWSLRSHFVLAQRLLAQFPNLYIVLTGSPQERELTQKLISGGQKSPQFARRVLNVAGEVPLFLMPALLQRFNALVTPDTGIMHMAVAVGTPVVALFAVSDWRRSGPAQDRDKHAIIQKWRTCSPCLSKRCPHAEPMCMALISVEEVEIQLLRLLKGLGA